MKLNLVAKNTSQQAIKDYLENNASQILADKINNGVQIEKDGKTLLNKKDLDGFWNYASKKARELKHDYEDNDTVFGWAIHYFEENELIGSLLCPGIYCGVSVTPCGQYNSPFSSIATKSIPILLSYICVNGVAIV